MTYFRSSSPASRKCTQPLSNPPLCPINSYTGFDSIRFARVNDSATSGGCTSKGDWRASASVALDSVDLCPGCMPSCSITVYGDWNVARFFLNGAQRLGYLVRAESPPPRDHLGFDICIWYHRIFIPSMRLQNEDVLSARMRWTSNVTKKLGPS